MTGFYKVVHQSEQAFALHDGSWPGCNCLGNFITVRLEPRLDQIKGCRHDTACHAAYPIRQQCEILADTFLGNGARTLQQQNAPMASGVSSFAL